MRVLFKSALVLVLIFGALQVAHADDTTPPQMSNGGPSGTLPAATLSVTITLTTDEPAVCRYSIALGIPYHSMSGLFASATTTSHYAIIENITASSTHDYYIRCIDEAGNATGLDYPIHFIISPDFTDTTPPVISGGPSGTYAEGTRELAVSLSTNENATCRYATSSKAYDLMAGNFSQTGGSVHSLTFGGLKDGTAYTYLVRCKDTTGNETPSDYSLSWTIATSTAPAALPMPPIAPATPPAAPSAPSNSSGGGANASSTAAEPKLVIKITKNFRYGAKDDQIKSLQQYLISEGYLKGSATGNFFAQTETAIKDFQKKNGLEATGFVGPLTRAMIDALQKKNHEPAI